MLRFFLSALASAAVSIAVCIRARSRGTRPAGARIIDEAARAGRMTTARRISKVRWYPDDPLGEQAVKYEYFVDGRRYTMTRWNERTSNIRDELTVFWKAGRPGRAYVSERDKLGVKYGAIYVVPMAVFALAYGILSLVM